MEDKYSNGQHTTDTQTLEVRQDIHSTRSFSPIVSRKNELNWNKIEDKCSNGQLYNWNSNSWSEVGYTSYPIFYFDYICKKWIEMK